MAVQAVATLKFMNTLPRKLDGLRRHHAAVFIFQLAAHVAATAPRAAVAAAYANFLGLTMSM